MLDKQSPFKFLSPYTRKDTDIFFGREDEVNQLYEFVFQSRILLVYGQSGTGKTSLIQCGLAGRFRESDWLDLYIRHNGDINASLKQAIRSKLEAPPQEEVPPVKLLFSLYLDYLRPIYLIFDQFEELFILGSEEEQKTFIATILEVIKVSALPCKVIFAIREEYLAYLYAFEKEADSLFSKRLRVEPMSQANARKVIIETSRKIPQLATVSEDIAAAIVEAVAEQGRVRLPYLQVFLDHLYREAPVEAGRKVFDAATVARIGQLEDVLATFLGRQLQEFESRDKGGRGQAINFLKAFVTQKGTRRPLPRREIPRFLPGYSEAEVNRMIEFFEDRRILHPMENNQYELAHDSLAAHLFKMEARTVEIPALPAGLQAYDGPTPGLGPYRAGQAFIFWGREKETEELFDLMANKLQSSTTLLYGPTGVGKSSVVQAGLLPRLQQLFGCRLVVCRPALQQEPAWAGIFGRPPAPGQAENLLSRACFGETEAEDASRRFIIFDQLEEFFVHLEPSQLESFYRHIAHLLATRPAYGLLFVAREEFFSYLPAFQAVVPELLEKQLRLEPLGEAAAGRVVAGLLDYLGLMDDQALREQILQRTLHEGEANLSLLQALFNRIQALEEA